MKTRQDILTEITPIFKEVLQLPELVLEYETKANDIDAWDSLNHAILIGQVRKHYKVKFPLSDIISLRTIGDLCDLVLKVMEQN